VWVIFEKVGLLGIAVIEGDELFPSIFKLSLFGLYFLQSGGMLLFDVADNLEVGTVCDFVFFVAVLGGEELLEFRHVEVPSVAIF
jgi:hypothetical protein